MASYTTNLNLKKPAGSENVAIGDINNNMDTIDQAYGTLNGRFTTTTATITPESTTTLNNTNCKKSGNTVCFIFDMTVTTTSSSWNVVASIPSDYAPSANVYLVLADTDNSNTIYRGMITTDGNIYIWGAATSKQLRGSTSWDK